MMHGRPLDSAYAKLGRAAEHYAVLAEAARVFRSSNPYALVNDLDPQTHEQLLYATIKRQPPVSMSFVLGDCVHNLRSALDHAVYGLSTVAAGRTLTANERKIVCFPICGTEKEWAVAERQALRFLTDGQRERIRSSQPLVWDDPAAQRNHNFCLIRDLDNADKHRTLALTASAVELVGVGFMSEASVRYTSPLSDGGTIVARLPQNYDLEAVEPLLEVRVTIANGGDVTNPMLLSRDVDRVLDGAIKFVEYVLGTLAVQTPLSRG
jgi:hypothetical protein